MFKFLKATMRPQTTDIKAAAATGGLYLVQVLFSLLPLSQISYFAYYFNLAFRLNGIYLRDDEPLLISIWKNLGLDMTDVNWCDVILFMFICIYKLSCWKVLNSRWVLWWFWWGDEPLSNFLSMVLDWKDLCLVVSIMLCESSSIPWTI